MFILVVVAFRPSWN